MEFVQPIRNKEQIETMKILLAQRSQRDLLLFVMGINSGLRISDLLAMRVCDVIDERGRPKKMYTLRERKTGKKKQFPFNKTVQTAISSCLRGYTGDKERPLFVSQKKGKNGEAKAISRQQAWDILSKTAKRIGIEDSIGTHTLRKTFGYHAYNGGATIEKLQEIFNHNDPRVTRRYIGITQDDINNLYKNLEL